MDFIAISVGAILGANFRYLISRAMARGAGATFPFGTMLINVVGSAIVGFFVYWSIQKVDLDPRWRLFVIVGFCGSFTTFSGYAFETMEYIQSSQWALAAMNIFNSNLLCLAAVWAGIWLAQRA